MIRKTGIFSLALVLGLSLAVLPVRAQFYTMGADPGGLHWRSVETPTYRVIYPQGLDSLAHVYAVTMEQVAGSVGASAGFRPNAAYRRKMPVVLHAYTANANGQVTWTPHRVEMLTVPDAFAPEATPWPLQLALHESRHVAQMQYGAAKPFRWLNVLGGELAPGALAVLYCGPAFFEGDAVVAETALTAAGRGRAADFLEYYRVCFAAGDFRDYWRWRYGSARWYTPDYYHAGYLAVGGIRAHFDVPDLTARYYRRIADHHGFTLLNWDKTVREATGRAFGDAFAEVTAALQQTWAEDEAARAPFMPSVPVSAVPRRFAEYTGLTGVGDDLYAVRRGLTQPDQWVRISPDGQERRFELLGSYASDPSYSDATGRFYWSELVRDPRWPLRSYSVIRSSDGRLSKLLTHKTRYYTPQASDTEALLAVTEYPVEGGSRVAVLDLEDGRELLGRDAPDGMQVVETAWLDGKLYATALTGAGYGIYQIPLEAGDTAFRTLLAPGPFKIGGFVDPLDGQLLFECDLTGVNELYALAPDSGEAPRRLTNTRFGASDFMIQRDTLWYSVLQPEGRLIHKTALADLPSVPADFSAPAKYPFAEELSAGEPLPLDLNAPVEVSAPQPYSKLAHLFHLHSWLPLYFAYDSVDKLSLESLREDAGLGATAFFQNELGTTAGWLGYHAAVSDGVWRHSAHANFAFTGLYPVIEASLDFNDREALEYYSAAGPWPVLESKSRGIPALTGTVRTYIPWNFSSGGWLRGIVPSAKFIFSNDVYHQYLQKEELMPMHRTTLSLRGYVMQHTPDACAYPHFGLGAEVGYSFRWARDVISPSLYAYLYGYLPGVWETHGLRWSALLSRRLVGGAYSEPFANTAPRGFDSALTRQLAAYRTQFKATLDYKLPLIHVDRALLGPVAYLRNFELTLHGDYSAFSSDRERGNLYSVGADLVAVLGNLLWIPYETHIGVSWNYNGGASFDAFAARNLPVQRHKVELVFSVEM